MTRILFIRRAQRTCARALYRALLLLHPSGFRRRFAGELLCVFDEAAAESAASLTRTTHSLCAFGFCLSIALSLARHWFRQPVLWRTAGAIVGGGLTLLPRVTALHLRFPGTAPISSDALILLTAGVLTAIVATLVVTVVLFQTLRRRRV
jgi:hypothetical protein